MMEEPCSCMLMNPEKVTKAMLCYWSAKVPSRGGRGSCRAVAVVPPRLKPLLFRRSQPALAV